MKRAQVIPGFAESEVGLEMAGLTREQILRFKAEQKRVGAQNLLAALTVTEPSEVDNGDDGASERDEDGAEETI